MTTACPAKGTLRRRTRWSAPAETVRERFGLSQEALSRYTDVLVYFDATDPDAPLWRFVFQPEMGARGRPGPDAVRSALPGGDRLPQRAT